MDIKNLIIDICKTMSISGFEYKESKLLNSIAKEYFDEHICDKVGNHILVKKCNKKNAKKLLIDTHYDEIGFMVKDITKEGFLKVVSVGGIDAKLLPASEVVVYGNKPLKGIVSYIPSFAKGNNNLTPPNSILIDLGMTKEEIEKNNIGIGTAVGYDNTYCTFDSDKFVMGKSLDNKSCCAVSLYTISQLELDKLGCDIYVSLSAKEEVGHKACNNAAYSIDPDFAIVMDVGLGIEGKATYENPKFGEGPAISISALLNKQFTSDIINLAKEKELKLQVLVEPTGTGTHADTISTVRSGIPTALISLPILYMHSPIETLAISDFDATSSLLKSIIENLIA